MMPRVPRATRRSSQPSPRARAARPRRPPAATLTTDARCYAQGAPLQMTASGLTPRAPLTVDARRAATQLRRRLDAERRRRRARSPARSRPRRSRRASPQRRHAARRAATEPRSRVRASRCRGRPARDLQALERRPAHAARALSPCGASRSTAGRDRRPVLRVAALGEPGREVRRNAALGTTAGRCGTLTTAPRRVFPFAPGSAGRWLLVLDTHRRYRVQTSGPRAKIPVHVPASAGCRHAPPSSPHAPRRPSRGSPQLLGRARSAPRRRRRSCSIPAATSSGGKRAADRQRLQTDGRWTRSCRARRTVGSGQIDARGRIRARFTAPSTTAPTARAS